MTFIRVIILILLCVLVIKVLRMIALAIKNGHSTIAIFISPIKRLITWECSHFKVIIRNLFSTKVDIFKSLIHDNEVGVVVETMDYTNSNKILIALFNLTWQLFALALLVTNSLKDIFNIISQLKLNFIVALISIIITIIYVFFKVIKIRPYESNIIKSTMPISENMGLSVNRGKSEIKD